jgi:NADP-dependent 3-hydroxy acid dehydrogenase YdfG
VSVCVCLQNVFDVNVWGAIRVLQAVLPTMRKNRKGYVINLSSIAGIRGLPGVDFYTGRSGIARLLLLL